MAPVFFDSIDDSSLSVLIAEKPLERCLLEPWRCPAPEGVEPSITPALLHRRQTGRSLARWYASVVPGRRDSSTGLLDAQACAVLIGRYPRVRRGQQLGTLHHQHPAQFAGLLNNLVGGSW
jgi:hypothetical protein